MKILSVVSIGVFIVCSCASGFSKESSAFPVRELPLCTPQTIVGMTEEDARSAETARKAQELVDREAALNQREEELRQLQARLEAFQTKLETYQSYLKGVYDGICSGKTLPEIHSNPMETPEASSSPPPRATPTAQPMAPPTVQPMAQPTIRTYSSSRCLSGTCPNTGW